MLSPEKSGTIDALKDLEKEIREINPLVKIIQTVRCEVNLSEILDCRAYDAKVSCVLTVRLLLRLQG